MVEDVVSLRGRPKQEADLQIQHSPALVKEERSAVRAYRVAAKLPHT